jgi:hypothetical protein
MTGHPGRNVCAVNDETALRLSKKMMNFQREFAEQLSRRQLGQLETDHATDSLFGFDHAVPSAF